MGLFNRLIAKVRGTSTASALDWSEIEVELLASDLGPTLVSELLNAAKRMRGDDAEAAVTEILTSKLSSKPRSLRSDLSTNVIMVVGVNGTGKTTSVAKLATLLQKNGESVTLAAADTFRAAAVDQLSTWGQRIGVEVIAGKENAEPASVAFDSVKRAVELGSKYLIVDTAGRLHNKSDLMAELGKVKRVIEKGAPLAEVLLVIDGTTGQNGLAQAKIFSEAVEVTGLIVTKLDGSGKGGIAVTIQNQLGIPPRFIGTGEEPEAFAIFEKSSFVREVL